MSGGLFDASHAMGDVLGRLILGLCALLAIVLLVPIGLGTLGLAAIFALAGGGGGGPSTGAGAQMLATGPIPSSVIQTGPGVSGVIGHGGAAARGLISGWANRGPLNQYERFNYRSDQSWLTWRNAACSAAALDWLLGAYGQQLGSLDDAIALVGPGTGISPKLGLLDARGPALARAIAARGLDPRVPRGGNAQPRPLGSIAELKAWLDQGPLLMDGARWFGEGHWFVGIGYDAGGVYIRDSSGWDNRYLSWSRLYTEVGFSGWVVGVAT
jgi:hypothetical protein